MNGANDQRHIKRMEWLALGLGVGSFPIMVLYGVAFAVFGDRGDVNHVIAHLRLVFGVISIANLSLGVAAEIWAIHKGFFLTKVWMAGYRTKKFIRASIICLCMGILCAPSLYIGKFDIFFILKLFGVPYTYFAFLCAGTIFLILLSLTYFIELIRIRMGQNND